MKKFGKLILLVSTFIFVFSMVSFADATFSANWTQAADGTWRIKDKQNNDITDAWVCDDAVASNGKEVWYLLDKDGNMVSAGLVQDGTGNFYSLETNHNGYYGMLRNKPGTYDGIYLDLESDHNGSFAAIKNQDGIDKLKAKYGLLVVDIDNYNIVYTSENIRSSLGNNGWVQYDSGDTYYYENGVPVSGWKSIGGNYYYFDRTTNAMLKSTYTPDGYYVNSEGVWVEKTATPSGQDSSDESADDSTESPDYEEPQIWDTAAKTNLVNQATKAANFLAQANALVTQGQKTADRKTAVKTYYKAIGQANGALEWMSYMEEVITARPAFKLSDGTVALTALNSAIKSLESYDNFEISDSVDITSAAFKNKMAKIADAAATVNKILADAKNMNASAITR